MIVSKKGGEIYSLERREVKNRSVNDAINLMNTNPTLCK